MHDTAELEARGVPAVLIASSEFTGAAAAQGSALGFEPVCVFVPHPIQDRSDDEMRALADGAVGDVVAALAGG